MQRQGQRLIDWGFFEDAKISEKFLRAVEDDTKTEDAVPYWKIDDFLRFPGFSWVWVVLRAARAKKVETKRFYTPPLGGQKTQAYCLAPQKNLLTGCVSKPFSKHMWRPEMR